MKKRLLIILIVTFSLNCFSQTKFEKGYFINNDGITVNCLIKNIDWKNNPTEFEYKLNAESKTIKVNIELAKEFGILNISKYRRFYINIDRSSNLIRDYSTKKAPQFNKETLYLKQLIEGDANLYFYEDGNVIRYFYNLDNKDVEQLIFKEYQTKNNEIGVNNGFKQQLLINFKCDAIQFENIKTLQYKKNDLINIFIKYNQCKNTDFVYVKENKRNKFNLSIRPGVNFSSLTIVNDISKFRSVDFGSKIGARIGLEAEFILSFNNNKWAVIIEPNYQYFKANQQVTYIPFHLPVTINANINYKSIEVPIGVRHYFFLNKKSKLFLNGLFVWDFAINSTIEYEDRVLFEIQSRNNFGFGLGCNYDNKFSLETRYTINRDLLRNNNTDNTNYGTFSIILGYNLL